jgi:hypothetical protein
MVQFEISTAKWSNSSAMKPVLILSPQNNFQLRPESPTAVLGSVILNRKEADTELNNSPTSLHSPVGVKRGSADTGLELIMFMNQ